MFLVLIWKAAYASSCYEPASQIKVRVRPLGYPFFVRPHPSGSFASLLGFFKTECFAGQNPVAVRASPFGIHGFGWHVFNGQQGLAVFAEAEALYAHNCGSFLIFLQGYQPWIFNIINRR